MPVCAPAQDNYRQRNNMVWYTMFLFHKSRRCQNPQIVPDMLPVMMIPMIMLDVACHHMLRKMWMPVRAQKMFLFQNCRWCARSPMDAHAM